MKVDRLFSLGFSYYEIMDLSSDDLYRFLTSCSRHDLINWLEWNDPNGVYNDIDSFREFGNVMSKDEGVEIIMRQIGGDYTLEI
jgi:hypothetical protein